MNKLKTEIVVRDLFLQFQPTKGVGDNNGKREGEEKAKFMLFFARAGNDTRKAEKSPKRGKKQFLLMAQNRGKKKSLAGPTAKGIKY